MVLMLILLRRKWNFHFLSVYEYSWRLERNLSNISSTGRAYLFYFIFFIFAQGLVNGLVIK